MGGNTDKKPFTEPIKKTKRSRAKSFAVAIVGRATTEWRAIEKIHNILI